MPNTAVITFGRFNPITVGHEKLVNKVKSFASSMDADPFVYLSHSHNNTNNPIPYDIKIDLATKAFGDVIVESDCRNIIQVANRLNESYNHLVVFVGSDRVLEFDNLLNKYNGTEYDYESIDVLSAGYREADSNTVEGMSGTKLRKYAINNDVTSFTFGLPLELKPHANFIMNTIRKGLNYE